MGKVVTSIGWDGAMWTLVHKADGSPVECGESYADDTGTTTIAGGDAPHKPSSSGYVHVRDRQLFGNGSPRYYAHVFGMEWVHYGYD